MSKETLRRIRRSRALRALVGFLKWLVKTWWYVWMLNDWR